MTRAEVHEEVQALIDEDRRKNNGCFAFMAFIASVIASIILLWSIMNRIDSLELKVKQLHEFVTK